MTRPSWAASSHRLRATAAAVVVLAAVTSGCGLLPAQTAPPSPSTSPSPVQSPTASAAALTWSEPQPVSALRFLEYSMAVDEDGVVHVAGSVYQDGIFYATNAGGTWVSQRVTTAPGGARMGQDAMPIMGLDGSMPTIAFVRYRDWGGEGIAYYPIDPEGVFLTALGNRGWIEPVRVPIEWNGPPEAFARFASSYPYDFDVADRVVHLAWSDDDGVWHATNSTREWVRTLVEGTGAAEPRLRLISDGTPQLVFTRQDAVYFAIAPTPAGGFARGTARIVSLAGWSPLLTTGPDDVVGVVYHEGGAGSASGPDVRYASKPFGSAVPVFAEPGTAHSVVIGETGVVHVIGVVDDGYVYSTNSSGAFSEQVIHPYARAADGRDPLGAIAVDGGARVHVLLGALSDDWELKYTVGATP